MKDYPYNYLLDQLDKITVLIDPKKIITLVLMTEDDFIAHTHHGLGQWLRNNWGLWNRDSEIYNFLKDTGLYHPDDMSGFLLTCWHRYQNNKPLLKDKQVLFYKTYWKKENI